MSYFLKKMRFDNKLNLSLKNIIFIFLSIQLVTLVILRITLIFSYSSDIGGVENNVVYSISKYISNGSLYDDPEAGNFNITQYSPLYYNIVSFFCEFLKVNSLTDIYIVYIIGRLLSLFFCVIGGIFMFKIFRNILKIDLFTSFLLIVIYSFLLTRIQFSTRPDSLLSLLTIIFFYNIFKKNDLEINHFFIFIKKNVIFVLLTSLAILTKQNGIQFLFFFFVYFLYRKEYFNSILSFIYFFIVSCTILYISKIISGEFFFENIIGGVNNGFSFIKIIQVFQHFYSENSILLLIIFSSFIYIMLWNRSRIYLFFCTSIILMLAFALITSGKVGSWINYYNEFLINGLILIGIAFKELEKDFKKIKLNLLFASYFIIFQFPLDLFHNVYDEHYFHIKTTENEYLNSIEVARFLSQHLNENEYFLSFDLRLNAMLPLKSLVPNKDLVPYQSKFNYDKLKYVYDKNLIKYVVSNKEINNLRFMNLDFRTYKKIDNKFSFVIYKNIKFN